MRKEKQLFELKQQVFLFHLNAFFSLKQTNESIFHLLLIFNEQWVHFFFCIEPFHLFDIWRIRILWIGYELVIHSHCYTFQIYKLHTRQWTEERINMKTIMWIDDGHFLWNNADLNNYISVSIEYTYMHNSQ